MIFLIPQSELINFSDITQIFMLLYHLNLRIYFLVNFSGSLTQFLKYKFILPNLNLHYVQLYYIICY